MLERKMYLDKLEMYLHRDVVKIITGVRRSGKTTLIKQFIAILKANGVPDENIIYLNLEGMVYAYFHTPEELRDMLVEFINHAAGHVYIFLDEAQAVEGWAEVAAEMLNLHDCDIYASASNNSIFQNNFAKLLGYRYVKIDVYPLTFGEYLDLIKSGYAYNPPAAGGADPEGTGGETEVRTKTKTELFLEYINTGCMPGVYSLKDPLKAGDYLSDVYSTIILKDVVQCNNLRDINHLDKIMEFLMGHMGEAFSPKAIRDHVSGRGTVISVDTVYSCLEALTGAFLIYKIPRYDVKADRKLETLEKYYFCDTSMRNAVMYDEGAPMEAVLENVVCREMLGRGFEVYTAKSGQSMVDFLAVKGQDRTYLNVCSSVVEKEAVKKEFNPLTRIKDNYFKMVLTLDEETMVNKGGIINYPLVDFLAAD